MHSIICKVVYTNFFRKIRFAYINSKKFFFLMENMVLNIYNYVNFSNVIDIWLQSFIIKIVTIIMKGGL